MSMTTGRDTMTTTLNSTLGELLMKIQDLVPGMKYKFPYSQIVWTYTGGNTFYSPEYDTYKTINQSRLAATEVHHA